MSEESRVIPFIDTEYKQLFTVPDGGYIDITRSSGEIMTRKCEYMDETHVRIGNEIYHIHQFALMMERAGNTYEACPEPEIVQGYLIRNRMPVGDKVVVLAHNPEAVSPYVTWQGYEDKSRGLEWGHYWSERHTAEIDYEKRVDSERFGIPYDHTTLLNRQKDRGDAR